MKSGLDPWRHGACRMFGALLVATALSAQEPPQDLAAPPELTTGAIEARIAALASAPLDDPGRAAAREAYEKALELVRAGDEDELARIRWQGEATTATTDLARVEAELKQAGSILAPPTETPLAELELLLERRQAESTANQTALGDLERELARRTERRTSLPQRIPAARSELEAVAQQLVATAAPDVHPAVTAGRRTRRLAKQRALQLEIASAEQELLTYAATEQLVNARRDLTTRRVAVLEAAVLALQERVQAGRTDDARRAERAAREALQDLAGQHPLLAGMAQENARLAHQRTELAERHGQREKDLSAVQTEYQRLQHDLQDVRNREVEVGLTDAIGALLRQRRSQLPVVGEIAGPNARQLRLEMTEAQLARFDADEQRQAQLDTVAVVDSLFAEVDPPIDDLARLATLRTAAAEILRARLETLEDLRSGHSRLFELLVRLSSTRHLLTELVVEYRDYVNERVLWIRSSRPLWSLNGAALGESRALVDGFPELGRRSWGRGARTRSGASPRLVAPSGHRDPVPAQVVSTPHR